MNKRSMLLCAWVAASCVAGSAWAQMQTEVPPLVSGGDQDGLRTDTAKLQATLQRYGIASTFEEYKGTHTSAVAVRFQNFVMPFFSKHLAFE